MKYLCAPIVILLSICDFLPGSAEQNLLPAKSEIVPVRQITLKEAVMLTLENNPEFKSLNSNIKMVQSRKTQAGFGPEPELDIEIENFAGSGNNKGFDSAETTVQLSQLIQLGNPTDKRVKIADYQTRLAESNRNLRQLEIVRDLAKTYIGILYLQEKTALARESLNNIREVQETIHKRVIAGKDRPIATARAKIETAKAANELEALEKRLEYYLPKLFSYWDSTPDIDVLLVGKLDDTASIPEKSTILARLQNSPELLSKAVELQISKARAELARTQGQPDIIITGGARYSNESNDSALVIGLSMPLKNSRLNNHIQKEANIAIEQAQYQRKNAELILFNQVNMHYVELELAISKLDTIKNEILVLSEEILTASRKSYLEGKTNYLELLEAQKIHFESKNHFIDSLIELHYVREELEFVIGGFFTETNTPEQSN